MFTITALVCLALVVLTFVRDMPGRWWQLAGALLYLAGCVVRTMAGTARIRVVAQTGESAEILECRPSFLALP